LLLPAVSLVLGYILLELLSLGVCVVLLLLLLLVVLQLQLQLRVVIRTVGALLVVRRLAVSLLLERVLLLLVLLLVDVLLLLLLLLACTMDATRDATAGTRDEGRRQAAGSGLPGADPHSAPLPWLVVYQEPSHMSDSHVCIHPPLGRGVLLRVLLVLLLKGVWKGLMLVHPTLMRLRMLLLRV